MGKLSPGVCFSKVLITFGAQKAVKFALFAFKIKVSIILKVINETIS